LKTVSFTILGEPKSKQRARILKNGHRYTPEDTVNYEVLVKEMYAIATGGGYYFEGPVKVDITAYFSIPRSVSKKKRTEMLAGKIRPMKLDCDNIAKIIFDGLNGVAFKDDKQVVELKVIKFYSASPCVDVKISEVLG
jgi:Holliday junction resolvase RusA-like endonuclease